VSNKMNEVMKVLTIIATIFMPMTFIAGIYGMNFKYMPELDWHWAYPVIWAVIIVLGVLMLMGFKRKKWL
jgi:magnesium transporter